MPIKSNTLPKAWPKEINYLNSLAYTSAITAEIKQSLHQAPSNASIIPDPSTPYSMVSIKRITLVDHPAYNQNGLFASRNLPPSSFIILYLGLLHDFNDTDPSSSYDLSVDAELGVGIDAQSMGNEARFINDYRGIREKPNAEFKDVWVRTERGTIERRIGVFALGGKGREKGIRKGEEILVSYGKGFWKARMANPVDTHEVHD
jgi:hypothetical protein